MATLAATASAAERAAAASHLSGPPPTVDPGEAPAPLGLLVAFAAGIGAVWPEAGDGAGGEARAPCPGPRAR